MFKELNEQLEKFLEEVTLSDLENAKSGSSFMDDRATIKIDGKEYIKIGKDKWEYHPDQSNAMPISYTNKQILDMAKDKDTELLEKLELIDKADPEFGLGDYYFASSEQDVFDSLDKMTLADSVGVFLKHKELDERHELTIELVEPDLYIMKIEEDSPETADDWEGKTLQDTDLISKEEVINTLNSIFQDYRVLTVEERRELHQLASQNESLKGYKEVAKILQNKEDGGFNVAETDEPMLVEDQPSLKTLLNNLVKYL